MLKASPPAHVENAIRKQAAAQGVPISQYLAPFLHAIAEGRITLVPALGAPTVSAPAK